MDTMITVDTRHRGCFFCSGCLRPELPLTFAFWVFGDQGKALLQRKWHLAFFAKVFWHKGQSGETTGRDSSQLKAECSFWTGGFLVLDALEEPKLLLLLCRLPWLVFFSAKWASSNLGLCEKEEPVIPHPTVPSLPLSCLPSPGTRVVPAPMCRIEVLFTDTKHMGVASTVMSFGKHVYGTPVQTEM